jgi:S1-C subfamily serine protease
MRRLLPALLLLVAPGVAADDEAAIETLFKDRAPAIVSVKFVLAITFNMQGESQKHEQNAEVRGVMIDASGLVMLANDHFAVQLPPQMRRRGAEIQSSPSAVKILFGNEAKEHDAVIVARDSNLNLAFVQILDLESREVPVVDLSKSAETKIGAPLLGITRMSRGFDCAPQFGRVLVTAKVEKPRPMWAVASNFNGLGLPVFDIAGAVVGVLASQEGSEGVEGGGDGVFLLPLASVKGSIDQAKKLAPEKVKKALAEKEQAAEAPAEKPAEEPAPEGGKEGGG